MESTLGERIGDMHAVKNNFQHNLKPFDVLFVFLIFCTFHWLKSEKCVIKSKSFSS